MIADHMKVELFNDDINKVNQKIVQLSSDEQVMIIPIAVCK